jgi:16S rRNA (cytosine967-C5)-methyltransferase
VQTTLVPDLESALQLQKRENIFSNRLFKEGWFEIQDAGSQQIASFLMPRSGETVIDACAGAGGKSLHLAALMNNKGRIISMDVEDYKLEELKKRARRANAHNIETKIIDKSKTIQALQNRADRLLLDVPCSGLGVLKRNPDAKWKLNKEKIEKTSRIQREILQDYSPMVKPGGTLVYSTCSILPSENEKVVQAFLEKNKNYELKEAKHLLPSQGFDGFYMARLERLT